MPNFVKVDSKPFHPDTYIGPEGEDEDAQAAETAREKSMTIKLKVENTVRWRWVKDENGQDVSATLLLPHPFRPTPCVATTVECSHRALVRWDALSAPRKGAV